MSEAADDVLAQIPPFLEAYGAGPHFLHFLGQLADRHPDRFEELVLIGYRVAHFQDKLEAAGFADRPVDYFYRPIFAGAFTVRDIRDGTVDVDDIIAANDALDRLNAPPEEPKPRTKEAEARQWAEDLLKTGQVTTERGGMSRAARVIAPMVGMTVRATENAIRDLFHT